jgi:hypothetical protein
MDRNERSKSDTVPKLKNLMNRDCLVNHGIAIRPHAPPRRPRAPGAGRPMRASPSTMPPIVDVGTIDVDALLEDNDDTSQQRQHVESLRGSAARQAANALQQVGRHNAAMGELIFMILAVDVGAS